MAKESVLVIDDEKDLIELLRYNLEKEGFRVEGAPDGESGLAAAARRRPDILIVDLMLPGMDGLEVCRRLRADAGTASVPIIMLTAKSAEADRVVGLELGADDYVTKPFSPRELAARVRAVLRRLHRQPDAAEVLRAADITLDRAARTVAVQDRRVDLTPSEFDLLAVLMTSPGRVYSRADLLDRLQGDAYAGYERTIDVHVRNLRTKIESDPSRPRYIETVFGVGYRFAVDR